MGGRRPAYSLWTPPQFIQWRATGLAEPEPCVPTGCSGEAEGADVFAVSATLAFSNRSAGGACRL